MAGSLSNALPCPDACLKGRTNKRLSPTSRKLSPHGSGRKFRRPLLAEESFNRRHWQEQPPSDLREFQESVFSVKCGGSLVFRIDDHSRQCNLSAAAQTAVQGVHQQQF